MRTKLMRAAFENKRPLVVAFPPNTPDLRKKKDAREITADCGHVVLASKRQRDLAKKLPICCVVCAFAAGVDAIQIRGLDDVGFRMTRKMKAALVEARSR